MDGFALVKKANQAFGAKECHFYRQYEQGNLGEMYHKSSTDDMPHYHYHPDGADSWSTWQRVNADGALTQYEQKEVLPHIEKDAIIAIYEDLSRKELLDR
ncbi:hypothetical protein J437_LFUL017813 [Ladona fulva]|uniref:Uncharacterized protein n=1 Tax=Ladona fulva TaxID=123851 RepID=A0A8K0PCA2_LADFU|nr:hypothetical protein J437_LFUL017813 [Ladona fulva]